jgi:hypothetical protein
MVENNPLPDKNNLLDMDAVRTFLQRRFAWHDRRNLYAAGASFLDMRLSKSSQESLKSLADWNRFWSQSNTNSRQGKFRYQGGNILAKLAADPNQVQPKDFRLRSDCPGFGAGNDARYLGADVDMVGPGKSYERWKTKPDYQQWLKDTGQAKK